MTEQKYSMYTITASHPQKGEAYQDVRVYSGDGVEVADGLALAMARQSFARMSDGFDFSTMKVVSRAPILTDAAQAH